MNEHSLVRMGRALNGMTTRTRPWKTIAKHLLGRKAIQNIGDGSGGQFALVTACRDQIDFCLWATRDGAENLKNWLDLVGCCRGCWPKGHYIVDLEQPSCSLQP